MASVGDIEVVLKAKVTTDAPFTDVIPWTKKPELGPGDKVDAWERYQFVRSRSSHPNGDCTLCTLCGAVVGHDGLGEPGHLSRKLHYRWHVQMASVEELALKWFTAKGENEMEQARADTVALRAELADTPPLPNPANRRP